MNCLWSYWNLRLARRNAYHHLVALNSIYDLLMWAAMLAFGILVYFDELWDRSYMCDGQYGDREDECRYFSEAIILPLDLTGAGIQFLIAVIQFTLLVVRCTLDIPRVMNDDFPFDERYELSQGTVQDVERYRLISADTEEEEEEEEASTAAVAEQSSRVNAPLPPEPAGEEESLIRLE